MKIARNVGLLVLILVGYLCYHYFQGKSAAIKKQENNKVSLSNTVKKTTENHSVILPTKKTKIILFHEKVISHPIQKKIVPVVPSSRGNTVSVFNSTVPSNLVAVAVSPTIIHLTWLDNSTIERGYSLERMVIPIGQWVVIKTLPPNTISCDDNSCAAGTSYGYRIRTIDTESLYASVSAHSN
jgi:hypothetical protein